MRARRSRLRTFVRRAAGLQGPGLLAAGLHKPGLLAAVGLALFAGACSSGAPDGARDLGGALTPLDGALSDGNGAPGDLAPNDASTIDSAANDFAPNDLTSNDFALRDLPSNDLLSNDLPPGDLAPPSDLVKPPSDLTPARPPCLNGAGFAAFRFHYSQNSGTQAILDAFGLPDSSNWEAVPVYPTSYTDPNFGGGIELGSGNWILIRYSVVGLSQINHATFSVYGRSYDVSASGSFDAWSPLYGDDYAPTDSMSVYPYAWRSVDFTGYVQIGDDPGLTGIRLYPGPSSDDLIVQTVELCIDGQ
jgi:hypothetical protein